MFIVLVVLLGHHWLAHGANQCFADAIPALERLGDFEPCRRCCIGLACITCVAESVFMLRMFKATDVEVNRDIRR